TIVPDVASLGGDVAVTVDGGSVSGNAFASIALAHLGKASAAGGTYGFSASNGTLAAPGTTAKDHGDAELVELEVAGIDVKAWVLPKLRGNGRVVGVVSPRLATDEAGNVLVDARLNTTRRLNLLRNAVKALRARFEDDLVLVVAPAGYFGFKGLVPLKVAEGKAGLEAKGELVQTTVGRVLFSSIVPNELPFSLVNRPLGKKALGELIDRCYRVAGAKKTVLMADALMQMGFKMSTAAGISICIDDMKIPSKKAEMLDKANTEARDTEAQYNDGLITVKERYNKVVDIWSKVTDDISLSLIKEIKVDKVKNPMTGAIEDHDSFNAIWMMVDSGARGSTTQIRQLAGMRGLMAKPSGEIIETPITANFREGLTVLQYFISTHGARKGLADTALKTANSGYLTRRLVDVVQDTIITAKDCGTRVAMDISSLIEGGEIIEHVGERVLGRVAAEDILDPYSDEILVARNGMIDEAAVDRIVQSGVDRVKIRSVMSCDGEMLLVPQQGT
ncbi:MAG: hypothetical protein ACK4YP_23110, partial [Myxococcota bacterium]